MVGFLGRRSKDPSSFADSVTDIIKLGMEFYNSLKKRKKDINYQISVDAKHKAFTLWKQNPATFTGDDFFNQNNCNMSLEQVKIGYDERIPNKVINALSTSKYFWSVTKTRGNNFAKYSFSRLTKDDGTIAVSSEDKAALFVAQFARNSTLDTQKKQPPTISEV